jgi:hypothetical protein
MLLGPVMMMFFVLACLAMMFFVMRRHSQPIGVGSMPMNGMSPWGIRLGPWKTMVGANAPDAAPSVAFEEYRQQTLHRLEQEQAEFKSFLDQLRFAKDKAEFDRFMAERQSAAGSSNSSTREAR